MDEKGQLVQREEVVKVSTLRVNQRAQNATALEKAMQEVKKEAQKEEESAHFDPRMQAAGKRKERRALSFVDPGEGPCGCKCIGDARCRMDDAESGMRACVAAAHLSSE